MIDYLLTEEQVMIRDLCRQITDEKIRPVAAKHDESQEFPWEVMKVMAEADLSGSTLMKRTAEWAAEFLTCVSLQKNFPRAAEA